MDVLLTLRNPVIPGNYDIFVKDRSLTAMLDYDDFDFQEHMEEERELSQQKK